MNDSMESTVYTINGKEFELQHYGVKGMRWGRRKGPQEPVGAGYGRGRNSATSVAGRTGKKISKAAKKMASKLKGSELANRGKAALDVLKNGDTDWMGRSTASDDVMVEAKNRGKAALERLMYSEKQIENKKFFGSYNPFD